MNCKRCKTAGTFEGEILGRKIYRCPQCGGQFFSPRVKARAACDRRKLWHEKSEAALKRPAVKKRFDAYMKLKQEAKAAHREITRQCVYLGMDIHTAREKHLAVRKQVLTAWRSYVSEVWK